MKFFVPPQTVFYPKNDEQDPDLLAEYANMLSQPDIADRKAAFARMQKFAEALHLEVQSLGALPLPPSLWHWDGLARTPRGVYELRMDLADKPAVADAASLLALEHRYYPDALPNSYIEAAERLPEVQKVLWFARFPVTRFHKEGQDAIVEISDLRFPQVRRDRPASFTYRVRLDEAGRVISQGWLRN